MKNVALAVVGCFVSFAAFAETCVVRGDFSVKPPPTRAFRDVPYNEDLRARKGVEFDVECPDVTQFTSFSCYFKSGDGWYSQGIHPGFSGQKLHVTLRKSAMRMEGSPSGWGALSAIRLCGWRAGTANNASFTVSDFRPFGGGEGCRVAVITPDSVAKKTSESGIGQYADNVVTTLEQLGVDARPVSDEDLEPQMLDGIRLVVLPYNVSLTTNAAAIVEAFAKKGGKLFACYTLPDPVGKLLGFGRGKFVQSDGKFRGFVREGEGFAGQPQFAPQASWAATKPELPPDAKVRAWWGGDDGTKTDVPALVETPRGAFMSHVWFPEIGIERLALMASVVGAFVPELREGMEKRLVAARAEREENRKWIASLPSAPGEWRAFWCHSAYGIPDGTGWDESIKLLKDGGFNAVVANLAWGASAYYKSSVLPLAENAKKRGDALDQLLAACRKHGVECHVWKVCFNPGSHGDKDFLDRLGKEGRLQSTKAGSKDKWLCPSQPANKHLEVDAMVEIAKRGVDGIHFDYIRYPNPGQCLCAGCRERFEKTLGAPVKNWPADVELGGALHAKWHEFRAAQITDVVRATRERLRKESPKTKVSAAVFNNVVTLKEYGQDWPKWCREGLLDFVCPMNYVASSDLLRGRIAMQRAALPKGFPLRSGLGLSTQPSGVAAAAEIARQILALRELGEKGFIVFDLGSSSRAALKAFAQGVTAPAIGVKPAKPGEPEPIAAAVQKARTITGQKTITLADGFYRVDKSIVVDDKISNLVIRAERPGKAVICGGETVTNWTREADGTWSAPVAVKPDGSDAFYFLLADGKPLARATWPVDGSRLQNRGGWNVPGLSSTAGGWARKPTDAERRAVPYFATDLPPSFDWRNAQIRLFHMWSETLAGIASNDDATATWTLSSPAYWPAGARGRKDYVLENVREGLSREGTWMLDYAAGRVRYRPRAGEDPAKMRFVAARTRTLLSLCGSKKRPVRNVRIEGIAFEASGSELHDAGFGGSGQPAALNANCTADCTFSGLAFRGCAGVACKVTSSQRARVEGCVFSDTGAMALQVDGDECVVERNRLLRSGVLYSSAAASNVRGKGNVFRFNEIDWAAYCGLISGGREMRIESNRVSRAMRVLHDGAAFYGGMKNGVTRGNVVTDCVPNGSGYGVSAYYWDEQSRDCVVEGNVSLNVSTPVHFHMARNVTVRDNTFVSTNGMKISFANSRDGEFYGNRCCAGGKFEVYFPEGVKTWRDNLVVTTNSLGAIEVVGGACVKRPRPSKGNAQAMRLKPGEAPKIDGKVDAGEYGAPSLFAVDRGDDGCALGFMPSYAGLAWDATNLYAAVKVVYDFDGLDGVGLGSEWGKDDGAELTLGKAKLRAFAGGKVAWPSPEWEKRVRFSAGITDGNWGKKPNCAVYEFAIPFDLLGVKDAKEWTKLDYNVETFVAHWRDTRYWEAGGGTLVLRPLDVKKK